MNLVENVYEIAESFMKDSSEVEMNYGVIEKISQEMLEQGPTEFPLPYVENPFKAVLLELVASSINYCYWYGKSTIRPNGAGATFLRECLGNAFFDYKIEHYQKRAKYIKNRYETKFNTCLTRFINLLIINRFPLIEERICHLNQLRNSAEDFARKVVDNKDVEDLNDLMIELITFFPGFASDIFLKRTFLFFIQMNRRFGWFGEEVKTMLVPADYQIPKMLEYSQCFSYSLSLQQAIQSNKLIPKNSIEECEIRSATILTVKKLCEITGWNVSDVDSHFFLHRHEVDWPFHLTITTDY